MGNHTVLYYGGGDLVDFSRSAEGSGFWKFWRVQLILLTPACKDWVGAVKVKLVFRGGGGWDDGILNFKLILSGHLQS
jgi:hypothetical protein